MIQSPQKQKRPRRLARIKINLVKQAFDNLVSYTMQNDELIQNGVSATALRVKCSNWRKLLNYLHEAPDTPQREEAEEILSELGLVYVDGNFNARTFYREDNLPEHLLANNEYEKHCRKFSKW